MQKLPFGTFFGTAISYSGQLSPFSLPSPPPFSSLRGRHWYRADKLWAKSLLSKLFGAIKLLVPKNAQFFSSYASVYYFFETYRKCKKNSVWHIFSALLYHILANSLPFLTWRLSRDSVKLKWRRLGSNVKLAWQLLLSSVRSNVKTGLAWRLSGDGVKLAWQLLLNRVLSNVRKDDDACLISSERYVSWVLLSKCQCFTFSLSCRPISGQSPFRREKELRVLVVIFAKWLSFISFWIEEELLLLKPCKKTSFSHKVCYYCLARCSLSSPSVVQFSRKKKSFSPLLFLKIVSLLFSFRQPRKKRRESTAMRWDSYLSN